MAHLLKNKLIVSCQATEEDCFYEDKIMHLFAKATIEGGAKGIRANSVEDINAIKKIYDVPMIGIIKKKYSDSDVIITPTINEVKELLEKTDVEVIALDATFRQRPGGEKLIDLVEYIRKNKPDVEIMADISTLEEAIEAEKLGFDYIGSTLRGYTSYTKGIVLPDIEFLYELVRELNTKVIAEGGIWDIEQLKQVIRTGVYAVVIGSAITRPREITKSFSRVMEYHYEYFRN